MKFLHLGDLHIGKVVNSFDMTEDQAYILNQIVNICVEEEVDGVLIAGDVYDRSIPSEKAVHILDDFLNRLSEAGKKVYLISGNHDSEERLHFGSDFFRKHGVYIATGYDGELYRIREEDAAGPVNIYLLPFVKASRVRACFADEEMNTYDEAVRTVIRHAGMNPAERNVLVAHQYVAGKEGEPELSESESATRVIGDVEKVSADSFAEFDYVALGHIHAPQKVGRPEVRYAGSPLKYSKSEVNHKKSVPIVELGEKGDVRITLRELSPLCDVRHLKGSLEHLLDEKNIVNPGDYVYVTLTDEVARENVMSIIRTRYPNCMHVCYENSHTRSLGETMLHDVGKEKTFEELIGDFYVKIYGSEISEEELRFISDFAKEMEDLNETN